MENLRAKSVSEYLDQLPEPARTKAVALRQILKRVAPDAREGLKWGKPVFESDTILFAYSAHKAHVSFIPTGPALTPFVKELKGYVVKKDSVQFPYDQPLPEELITRIAKQRKEDVEVNGAKWKY